MGKCVVCGRESQDISPGYRDDGTGLVFCGQEHRDAYEAEHGSLHTSPPPANDPRPVGSALGWGLLIFAFLALVIFHDQCAGLW